jgi:LacI family transcriptional regulator
VKKTTIKDVASLANVSYQTVSRVMNNKPEVHPATQARVLEAMKELNYRPDPVARSLVSRNSYTIGVVIATYTGHTCSLILQSADDYVRSQGYNLVILGTETHSSAEPDAGLLLSKQRLQGLLVIYHGAQDDPHKLLLDVPPELPIVSTGYIVDSPQARVIQINTYNGARDAIEYLISLGHRKFATVLGPSNTSEVRNRFNGFKDTLDRHELSFDPACLAAGDWSIESGYNAMKQILKKSRDFTGLFAHGDRMAIGAIRALWEAGLRVPQDVSVIGFNNEPNAKYSIPSLTTISYPAEELGFYSAKTLFSMIRKTKSENPAPLPPMPEMKMQLIKRESTISIR